jgi:hypothetical protein
VKLDIILLSLGKGHGEKGEGTEDGGRRLKSGWLNRLYDLESITKQRDICHSKAELGLISPWKS